MNKEEYYNRIEKINNRFKTDRVSADEEYQLVCQRNYLSTKYIENLEQQVKNQKEVIDKAINFIENGDLLYLANKNSIVYRNNIEVRAVADRLNDLLQILEDNRTYKNRKREEI